MTALAAQDATIVMAMLARAAVARSAWAVTKQGWHSSEQAVARLSLSNSERAAG